MRASFKTIAMVLLAVGLLGAGQAVAQTAAEEIAELALSNSDAMALSGLGLYLAPTDAKALAKLAAGGTQYVQGVVAERERAERLRIELQEAGNAERASLVWRRTAHLPYADNLVNRVVAEGWRSGELKDLPLAEVVRVLHPGGVGIVGSDSGVEPAALLAEAEKLKNVKATALNRKGAWIKIVKLPGSDQLVSPVAEVRWINTPLYGQPWSTYMNNSSGNYGTEVFAAGRSFHTEIEWIKPGVSQYEAVARDAFNGVVLWRTRIEDNGNIVCADDKLVYHRSPYGGPLIARDVATGAVVHSLDSVKGKFISQAGDKLIAVGYAPLAVIDQASGKTLWSRNVDIWDKPLVIYKESAIIPGSTVEALNLADGKSLWKVAPKELDLPGKVGRDCRCTGDTIYIWMNFKENEKVFSRLVALDAGTGAVRWSDTQDGVGNVTTFPDQVWYGKTRKEKDKDNKDKDVLEFVVLNAQTGKEIKTLRPEATGGACCSTIRGEDQYIMYGRADFLDRHTFEPTHIFGVRSACQAGRVPSNGLVWFGLHTCNCYIALRGVFTLAGASAVPKLELTPQVFKGSAAKVTGAAAGPEDWPIYRGRDNRCNSSAAELPAQLKQVWSAKLGNRALPQATGAAGMVFVAGEEQHRVVALDLQSGAKKWSFATEGRVSIAPTYYNGLCLFGDHAGWVYCLSAAEGKLLWQLQAAPEQKYMSAYDQFESSWPVKSGVLVFQERAYFVAGRCGTLDGGLYLYGVDLNTGEVQFKKNYNDNQNWVRAPKTADLLLSDGLNLIGWGGGIDTGKAVAAAPKATPAAARQSTLKFGSTWQGPNGILDMLGTMNPAGTYMKSVPSDGRASGETISFDATRTVVTGRVPGGKKDPDEGRGLVACKGAPAKQGVAGVEWANKETSLQMKAVLLAGTRVYCAGVNEFRDPQAKPALVILSAVDGKLIQRIPLESAPAIDGLSAVGGKLILTLQDGQVMCFGAN